MKACEEEIKVKTEVDYIFKSLDQFRLLKKLLLNEVQCFMLENRERHCIYNRIDEDSKKGLVEELKSLNQEKMIKNENQLKVYLKKKKKENNLTDIDNLLVAYLRNGIKSKLKEEDLA